MIITIEQVWGGGGEGGEEVKQLTATVKKKKKTQNMTFQILSDWQ